MIDKFICKVNKFIVFMIKRLTITIKTPFVDFSFAPMIVIALRFCIYFFVIPRRAHCTAFTVVSKCALKGNISAFNSAFHVNTPQFL